MLVARMNKIIIMTRINETDFKIILYARRIKYVKINLVISKYDKLYVTGKNKNITFR